MPRPKTRSKGNASSVPNTPRIEPEEQPEEPLKLLILPDLPPDASRSARFCTLPHPRTSKPCRYYYCPTSGPSHGIYEFIRTAAPKSACQSWLIGRRPEREDDSSDRTRDTQDSDTQAKDEELSVENREETTFEETRPVANGYAIKSPELFTATPIDPLFLILPSLLSTLNKESPSSRGVFLSFDDMFERHSEASPHFGEIINHSTLQNKLTGRMRAVCDTVATGDEEMYRLSGEKLLAELSAKARKMVASGLPPSMEEKFVRKALERPIMAIKREESTTSAAAEPCNGETAATDTTFAESTDSQASTATSLSMSSEASVGTNVTIPDEKVASAALADIVQLLRLRVALSYMFSAYIPQPLATTLNTTLAAEGSPIDFRPLEKELALISEMRREALASRSFSDFSRKRGMEDEEAAASRAEKKAKKEDEDKKRKASETRAVRDLKKVDVSGMKKMSDFFTKKPTAIKKS